MTMKTRIQVLDPTVAPIPMEAVRATRTETLDGLTVGLLANGKPNADKLLELVHQVLADKYEFKGVVARNKGNASRPCPRDLLEEMASQCDLVVTSTGD